jgi:ABC-type amino acid transport substrate-binding protein
MTRYQSSHIQPCLSRRDFGKGLAGFGLAGAAGLLADPAARAATAPQLKTVEPGYITVATIPVLPVTGVKDGAFIGTDGSMISIIAERLGLKAKPAFMDWSATIESVKTGRADVMLGNMGWTPQRAQIMLLTDAIYYTGAFVTMRDSTPVTGHVTVSDFSGRSVGAITGVTVVPELKKLPGVTDVRLYDTFDACVRDIVAGRLDFGVLDAPFVANLIQSGAAVGIKQLPIATDPNYPIMSNKQHSVMGMNGQNADLFDAVNTGVRWLWATKQNAALLKQYGMSDPDYLVAPSPDVRLGVDRTASGGIIGPFAHTMKDYSRYFA